MHDRGPWVDPNALLGDHDAVNAHPPGRDQLLTGPARTQPGPGQHLLQAHALRVVHIGRAIGAAVAHRSCASSMPDMASRSGR